MPILSLNLNNGGKLDIVTKHIIGFKCETTFHEELGKNYAVLIFYGENTYKETRKTEDEMNKFRDLLIDIIKNQK